MYGIAKQAIPRLAWFGVLMAVAMMLVNVGMAQRSTSVKPKTKKGKGKIVGIAPNAVQIQDTNKGEVWVIAPVPTSQIEFLAEAEKGWLARGMVARVTGTFDKKGMATEPVSLVQVFTPRPDYPMGAFWQGTGKPDRNAPQEFLVAGMIKRIDEGKYTIDGGRRQFTFQLADDASVEVDLLNDLEWIQENDRIRFDLKYFVPGEGMIAWAKIEGSNTLAAPVQPSRKRRRRRRRRSDPPLQQSEQSLKTVEESSSDQAVAEADEEQPTPSEQAEAENAPPKL